MGTAIEDRKETLRKPAVGVVATEDNADAVVRVIMLAHERGHAVFVAYDGRSELPAVEFARRLGAETIHPDDGVGDEDVLRQLLAVRARSSDFSGLLYHDSPEDCIDYEESVAVHESTSGYTVTARTKSEQADSGHRVVVAIPAHNESSTIEQVVHSVNKYADLVLVVDDGSDDGTDRIARRAGATVVRHRENQGYGAALKTAFREANEFGADALVVVDGDNQHEPDDVPSLLQSLEREDADIVIGSRFLEDSETDMPLYRRFGIAVINLLTNLSMGIVRSSVKDTQSGFRAYNARAVESLSEDDGISDKMSASTDILYHAFEHDYDIAEVGTSVDYNVDNANNHNPVIHGLTLINNTLKTIERRRPVTVLGIPGFVVTAVGLSFGYWTVMNVVTTQTFPVGLAIVSVFATLLGIFACFTAIILHSLTTHIQRIELQR